MPGVARINAALLKVAALAVRDPAFAPVFERLERELAAARAEEAAMSDVQRRARALLSQSASPLTSAASCSSDAPLP